MRFPPLGISAQNTLMACLLVVLLGLHWWRHGRGVVAGLWLGAVSLMFLSAVTSLAGGQGGVFGLFGYAAVSVALVLVFHGVRRRRGALPCWRMDVLVCCAHLCVLVAVRRNAEAVQLVNSLTWAVLSFSAYPAFLGGGGGPEGRGYAPIVWVFTLHGLFCAARCVVVVLSIQGVRLLDGDLVQSITELESGLFVPALFGGLLLSEYRMQSRELDGALAGVRALAGMLPICSGCKKIREDDGGWTRLETFIGSRSGAQFTHGLCPDCADVLYPEVAKKLRAAGGDLGVLPGVGRKEVPELDLRKAGSP